MEIVIENPSESQAGATNATAAAAAAAAAAVSAMSSSTTTTTTSTTITTTTTMTNTVAIEASVTMATGTTVTTTIATTNSALPFHRPHYAPFVYGGQQLTGLLPDANYYLKQRSPGPMTSMNDLDGAALTAVRRVDKSGLLEISEVEPTRYRLCRSIGADNIAGHAGTLPRRVDRSGLLEALPELPESRGTAEGDVRTLGTDSNALQSSYGGLANRHPMGSELERGQEVIMKPPPDVVALVQSPTAYDLSSRRSCTPSPSSMTSTTLLLPQENVNSVVASRTSPTTGLVNRRADGDSGQGAERPLRFCPTGMLHTIEPSLDGRSYEVPTSAFCATTQEERGAAAMKSPEKGVVKLAMREDKMEGTEEMSSSLRCEASVGETEDKSTETKEEEDGELPQGERAEAEGCEHTAIENLEEGRVSFKASSNKLFHNDNVQTLRVIILSEQL